MKTDKIVPHSLKQNYPGYTMTREERLDELQCTLRELTHNATGARIMHIENDDPENLFCLSFQTFPKTSNGVAHILEHTVLCGSEKFPVKDPFFAMTRRSLNTFMNALTGSDFTCYPAASQVPKDFYNLLEVYLDAVFKPNLKELSFKQEGIRLEFAKPDDSTSPLLFKGIVFNEMKGALSNPTQRLVESVNTKLFPHLTYGINSGGDPKIIPTLTLSELKEFHETYYHPSRCLFYFYGNMPLEHHLEFLSQHCLDGAQKKPPLPKMPREKRLKEPIKVVTTYPIEKNDELETQTEIAFAFLTCHILEQEEVLALNILEVILMDTDASPLKKALLKSLLCKQASAYAETEISEVPFVILLKGCKEEDADRIEKVIRDSLKELCDKGIPSELIENAIHQFEFFRKEITGDGSPYGLSLFMRSALLKQHGGDPVLGLKIHSLFQNIREKIAKEPGFFSKLITKYLIDNTHFVRVAIKPDPKLAKEEEKEEVEKLTQIRKTLDEQEVSEIIGKSQELIKMQEEEENQNIEVLPKVTLNDVPKEAKEFPLIKKSFENIDVYNHSAFTNDIIYADLIFPLPDISSFSLTTFRLFITLISQMGCGGRDYAKNLEYIQAHTGGIGANLSLFNRVENTSPYSLSIHFKGKALHRKAQKLFSLMRDMVESVDFSDLSRIKEVLKKHYSSLQSSITQSALRYAINLSSSAINEKTALCEELYGIHYYWKMKEMMEGMDNNIEEIANELIKLKEITMGAVGANLILSCDESSYKDLEKQQFYNLTSMKGVPFSPWKKKTPPLKVLSHARAIGSPVAFTAKAFPTVAYAHPAMGALCLASQLFDSKVLHTRIREQGGAYGGGSSCNPLAGTFYFYSYRDPHIVSTLQAFEEAISTVADKKFSEQDLESAKLELVQTLDSPVAPGSRAELAYVWMREGKTKEVRQEFRDRMLSATREEVCEAVTQHIIPQFTKGATVTFSGRELLEKENARFQQLGKETLHIEAV